MKQRKEQIKKLLEKSGHKSGSAGYIGKYQKVVDKLIRRMSAEQWEEAERTAKEWNEAHPTEDIQSLWVTHLHIMLQLTRF